MSIGRRAFERCEKLVIHAGADSYAAGYARDNGIGFAAADDGTLISLFLSSFGLVPGAARNPNT
ncbi:MAG: hypothetical protein LBK56_04250 [Gracilibacteraceae bacterium]|nr:hypothetical protein [Gracilibacteraceae bacterium]